jgi:hypothetical protein
MTTPITLDDIYALFRASQEDLQRSRAEFDRRLNESKAEADRRAAEFDQHMKESKAEFDQRFQESKAEADRRGAEIDRRLAKLEKTVERTSQAVDALTTRWGRFVESLVEPAVLHLFQARGIEVKEVHTRVHTKREGLAMEIDILAVDDTDLVLVECKSRLSQDDVNEFLEKLERFKQAFPHYASYNAYGAVAGIEVNEGVDRYAYRRGLFVIKPAGDSVAIVNDPGFRPRSW